MLKLGQRGELTHTQMRSNAHVSSLFLLGSKMVRFYFDVWFDGFQQVDGFSTTISTHL
jgi:hypothetical protein